ncbi:MAG: hypothetical protein AAF358_04665 [Pseudomonadota bacterium]
MRLPFSKWCAIALLLIRPIDGQTDAHFVVGTAAGDGGEAIAVRLVFDGEGDRQVSGSMSFSFDSDALTASSGCVSQTGDPLPDRVNFTHRVTCEIDNSAGTVTVSFSPLFLESATLSQRLFLGRIFFDVAPDFVAEPGGSTFVLPIVSVGLSDSDGFSSGNGSLMVIAGWPIDGFENDDLPVVASNMRLSDVGQATSDPFAEEHFLQPHTFDIENDEDWVYFQQLCDRPPPIVDVRISAIDPLSPGNFQPVLEIYPSDRLIDELVPPLESVGSCDAPSPAGLVVRDVSFADSRLLRIRNCVTPPATGIGYELRISKPSECLTSSAIYYSGRVIEAGSGLPVKAFLRSDSNVFSVSNQHTGSYRILGFIDPPEIEIISGQFLSGPFRFSDVVDGILPDIVVSRSSDEIFADGFD